MSEPASVKWSWRERGLLTLAVFLCLNGFVLAFGAAPPGTVKVLGVAFACSSASIYLVTALFRRLSPFSKTILILLNLYNMLDVSVRIVYELTRV